MEGRGGILVLLPTAGSPAKDRLQQSSGLNLHQPSIAAYLWSLYPGHPLSCNRSHKADVQAYPQLSLRSHVDKAPSCSLDHPRMLAAPEPGITCCLPCVLAFMFLYCFYCTEDFTVHTQTSQKVSGVRQGVSD